MRIVLVSDLQQHKWRNYPEVDEHGVNLRILDVVHELARIRQMALKNRVDALMVLGDIFESRNDLSVSVLNSVYFALKGFTDAGIRVVLLVGNHDRTGVGKEHALEVFTSFCEVVDKPTTLKMNGDEILALPFFPNATTTKRAIQHFTTSKTKLIVAHTAVQSLKMPNGQLWGQGISLDDIPPHTLFISGHYHRYTELIPGRAYFLGSMIQVDQSDSSFDKYFAVYDSRSAKLGFFETKGPRFVAIDIPSLDPQLLAEIAHVCKGNFVTVKSVPPGYADYGVITDALKSLGARHIEFALQIPLSIPPLDLASQVQGKDNMEIVKHYVSEQATDNLEEARLIEIGSETVEHVEQHVEPRTYDSNSDVIEIP